VEKEEKSPLLYKNTWIKNDDVIPATTIYL